MTRITALLLLTCAALQSAEAASTGSTNEARERLDVYVVNLKILTRHSLSSEDVRKMKHAFLQVNNKTTVQLVKKQLENLPCESAANQLAIDTRIVIDVIEGGDVKRSLGANGDFLVDASSHQICKLPIRFWSDFFGATVGDS